MQTTDKEVNGVIYERDYGRHNCINCNAFKIPDAICSTLVEDDCSHDYTFKIKDITKERHPAPAPVSVKVRQGVKTDAGKPQYDLIPPFALEQVAICLTEGLTTHPDADNWKLVKDGQRRFRNSRLRHSEQWRMGEVFDRDNPNVRNLAAIIVNALFELEFEVNPELNGIDE